MDKLPSTNLLKRENLKNKKYYHLKDLTDQEEFKDKLVIALGKENNVTPRYINLKDYTGILISGETGSGKSVFLHSIIVSLLLKNTENDLNIFLMSKNKIELNNYNSLPHLRFGIANKDMEILISFKKIVNIIKERREIFKKDNINNIDEYNLKNKDKLPEILIIVDEIGELINISEIERIIKNILKDGYKYGMHLILATSSYLKGYKYNNLVNLFDFVITLDLASKEQANFIKLEGGNWLNTEGDVLVKYPDNKVYRLQTPYVSLDDINNVVNFYK